ncbi:MAG: DUF2783 domain-containing protein [Gammaproteobacteria bacterium]|nr:DUF2783 domain-containing protein [Gammaproteobacteria bacterium]
MTQYLCRKPNLDDFDEVYQQIVDMHVGLSEEESQSANAKLIFTLANHIGDPDVIREAAEIARENTLQWRDEVS